MAHSAKIIYLDVKAVDRTVIRVPKSYSYHCCTGLRLQHKCATRNKWQDGWIVHINNSISPLIMLRKKFFLKKIFFSVHQSTCWFHCCNTFHASVSSFATLWVLVMQSAITACMHPSFSFLSYIFTFWLKNESLAFELGNLWYLKNLLMPSHSHAYLQNFL